MTIAQARILRSLDSLSLPLPALKPTAVDGAPRDATDNALSIDADSVDLGFWECSPGSFATARNGVNEVVLILEGSGTLVSDSGERLNHRTGDLVLIPDGWSGVWEIHEHLKKYYVTVSA
ncbi:cupin domain-containing protein [Leucobacter sp. wl10]|uniref:cupin domain-containing protein n=1 Tax=Leucobacter sp. wl10 TaxID=2304677 RepID=UPI000E5B49F0|nr:cupin domain-containing protein [Leucobacter sp. wl10]RGE21934.1 DUF861 domain-containing protein [Leucobacter sp. wl10]